MIIHRNTIISDDIKEKNFVCNLEKCKGACCVEGELGAPLEKEETKILEDILPHVLPYLTTEAKAEIDKRGAWVLDYEGDFSTPVINGKECVYAIYDENKILKCAIEKAHSEGKIDFKKPISCHLYPIRIKNYHDFIAVNYHQWDICNPACKLGDELKVPIYKFLKEPLIRKFGEEWYNALVEELER